MVQIILFCQKFFLVFNSFIFSRDNIFKENLKGRHKRLTFLEKRNMCYLSRITWTIICKWHNNNQKCWNQRIVGYSLPKFSLSFYCVSILFFLWERPLCTHAKGFGIVGLFFLCSHLAKYSLSLYRLGNPWIYWTIGWGYVKIIHSSIFSESQMSN